MELLLKATPETLTRKLLSIRTLEEVPMNLKGFSFPPPPPLPPSSLPPQESYNAEAPDYGHRLNSWNDHAP